MLPAHLCIVHVTSSVQVDYDHWVWLGEGIFVLEIIQEMLKDTLEQVKQEYTLLYAPQLI